MGRGDNRSTVKVRQRKQWRRKKARLKKKIEEGKTGKAAGGARSTAPRDPGATTMRRPSE